MLRARITALEGRVKRTPRVLIPGVAIIGLLYVLTLLASDTNGLIVTGFWAVVGAAILVWTLVSARKEAATFRDMATEYRAALEKNWAVAYDIRSSGFAEFEEVEDEGACYAFQIDGERMVFVSGQRYYPEARFPSHDFSIVHLLDDNGELVDEHIEKRGLPAEPSQFIPAFVKVRLDIPDHLDVLEGRIEDLETLLRSPDEREPA